jgi:hypothetical protein
MPALCVRQEENASEDEMLETEAAMPALLYRDESSDSENEMLETEAAMPELLYRDESSDSEDDMPVLEPVRKKVFRRSDQQKQKETQLKEEADDSSESEAEECDADGMPRLRRCPEEEFANSCNFESSKQKKRSKKRDKSKWSGLEPPELSTGQRIDGNNKRQLRRENKAKRISKQEAQKETSYWSRYKGDFVVPEQKEGLKEWVGEMCPSNLALHQPAAATLLKHASGGCPANTGRPWTKEEMQAAIDKAHAWA